MFFPDNHLRGTQHRAAAGIILAGLLITAILPVGLLAQQLAQPAQAIPLPAVEPGSIALPLPEDRGAAALEQSLKRLSTTASLMMIVAHPDDEDGSLLTYLSRGLGVRCTLLTLTRGEGGQNAMSADSYDALGLIRTNELLKAGEYYGTKQLWGTEIDFGFSKTQEEAFARWGHERVLYDAVLAVRRERPQIIVSTFVGGITDGHGHHQVSGEIAQEVFKAAADPNVFPEQLKPMSEGGLGLTVWQPLAVYSMVPFAPVTEKGMYDYATGKWAPAKFKNYVTGEWITGVPSTDVTLQVGTRDPALGRSYAQIARQGWGMQKSQNGGANPAFSGPASTSYHLWAVAPEAAAKPGAITTNNDLFHNSRVDINTSFAGLTQLPGPNPPKDIRDGLHQVAILFKQSESERPGLAGIAAAHKLAPLYRETLALRAKVAASDLDPQAKASLLFELDAKIEQFQITLKDLLGLDLIAFTTKAETVERSAFRGGSADETPRSVSPGEEFRVRVHTTWATTEAHLGEVEVRTRKGTGWEFKLLTNSNEPSSTSSDKIWSVRAADTAEPTEPYFTRPNTEQPYYDLTHPEYRERSFVPYPLEAWANFTFDDLPIRIGQVVQTMQRVTGPGGIYEPLVVTPAIGVSLDPEARILPLDGSALPVRVTIHAQAAAEGTVELNLPTGWTAQPGSAPFHLSAAGDSEPIVFSVTPAATEAGSYNIQALAHSNGHNYQTGWRSVGYAGLQPYNQYKPAQLKTRKIDVKLAPSLRIGYVMGTGDLVPEAIEGLGVTPHLLTATELASSDLSAWNVIVVGIRAYSVRPDLAANEARLREFVERGGTLIVQYQSTSFPAPFQLSMNGTGERVVDEQAPVKILDPSNALLTSPNAITTADFDGWLEERGHGFLNSWDSHYTALADTADAGQDPQRGGLLVAHPGKGTYVYVAYALYRQLPELVPGAYRILANLLSAGESTPSK
ncbi:MAG: PIG-L family deacetylase [Terracidiphilus sp.]|jgi:LmbE family N-acetylglucosaminyl deacetylase